MLPIRVSVGDGFTSDGCVPKDGLHSPVIDVDSADWAGNFEVDETTSSFSLLSRIWRSGSIVARRRQSPAGRRLPLPVARLAQPRRVALLHDADD